MIDCGFAPFLSFLRLLFILWISMYVPNVLRVRHNNVTIQYTDTTQFTLSQNPDSILSNEATICNFQLYFYPKRKHKDLPYKISSKSNMCVWTRHTHVDILAIRISQTYLKIMWIFNNVPTCIFVIVLACLYGFQQYIDFEIMVSD